MPLPGTAISGTIKPGQLNLARGWGGFFWGETDKDGRFRLDVLVPGVRMDAHVARRKPVNQRLIGDTLFEALAFKPGEVRDLGDIRVKADPR